METYKGKTMETQNGHFTKAIDNGNMSTSKWRRSKVSRTSRNARLVHSQIFRSVENILQRFFENKSSRLKPKCQILRKNVAVHFV